MDLSDVDLERGAVKLDENKTNDPRAWALGPDVVRGLRAFIALREAAAGAPLPRSTPLFMDETGERIRGEGNHAKRFRAHLKAAGIDRPELFERSAARMRIRLHDTRATFVTLSLANGKTETWVADRTGHKSSAMINRYRRAARTAAELGLGPLRPLDEVIPELAGQRSGGAGGPGATREGSPGGNEPGAPPVAALVDDADARDQGRDHAGLYVANGWVADPESAGKHDTSRPLDAPLNPLIGVRIPAPEPALTNDGPPRGRFGGRFERGDLAAGRREPFSGPWSSPRPRAGAGGGRGRFAGRRGHARGLRRARRLARAADRPFCGSYGRGAPAARLDIMTPPPGARSRAGRSAAQTPSRGRSGPGPSSTRA
jgi:Phage integrase family